MQIKAGCAEGTYTPALMIVKSSIVGDVDFINAIASPIGQTVVAAIGRYNLTEKSAFVIQHPDRAVTIWLMVDVDYNMTARMVRHNASNVHGFKMMTRHFPQHLSIPIHQCNVICPATGKNDTKVCRGRTSIQNTSTIQVPAGLLHYLRPEDPANRTIMIQ